MRNGILILLLSCLALICCSSKDDRDQEQSQVQRALHLMEGGDYDQAISLLKEARDQNPTPENSLHLASAYAARAGVKVETYWGFIVGYRGIFNNDSADSVQTILDLRGLPQNLPKEAREALQNLEKNLKDLNKIRRRVDQVPYLERAKRADLHAAIEVLTDVPSEGAHLYRGVLELILVKSAVIDGAKVAEAWARAKFDLCDDRFSLLIEWTSYSLEMLVNLADDLSRAYPKTQGEIKKIGRDLQKANEAVKGVRDLIRRSGRALCASRS